MVWQDQSVIVQQRPFLERKWIITVLTCDNGLYKGIVKSKNVSGWILGSQTDVTWESACEEGLGRLSLDPTYGPVPFLTHMPGILSAVNVMCLLCASLLPERVPMPGIYTSFLKTLALLPTENGLQAYNNFEIYFLEEIGYGHDEQSQQRTPLGALFARRKVFQKYWPDHCFLDKQRMAFLNDIRCTFQERRL